MKRLGAIVVVGILVVGLLGFASVLGIFSENSAGQGVEPLADKAEQRATDVETLSELGKQPWTTRLGAGGVGTAIGLSGGSMAAFLYHRRKMR